MKICVAQAKPATGNVQLNIDHHKEVIALAHSNGANKVFFPELSLTGYEPGLAKALAADLHDSRLNDFQKISDNQDITIGVGMPLKYPGGVRIGMIIFQPHQPRHAYSKQYLHPDEEPFFVKGDGQRELMDPRNKIALAICYEISIPEHPDRAAANGAEVYIASVAKSLSGVEKAIHTLSGIAEKYSMSVFMSNCIGHCDNFESSGRTSVWNNKGILKGQLDAGNEGILIFDPDTEELIIKMI